MCTWQHRFVADAMPYNAQSVTARRGIKGRGAVIPFAYVAGPYWREGPSVGRGVGSIHVRAAAQREADVQLTMSPLVPS